MTHRQSALQAEKSVQDTLKLIEKYGFEQVDVLENGHRRRYFYLQSNEQIGVLLVYVSGLKLNGTPNKFYRNHCIDVLVTYAKDIKEAIVNDKSNKDILTFWISNFRVDKPNHAYILDCLCHEQETDRDKLEAKYNELKKSKRAE